MSASTLTKSAERTAAQPASRLNTKQLVTMAMLSGIAYVVMYLSKALPSVNGFLDFDFKDVIICIAAGNEADLPIAAKKIFSEEDTEFKTFIEGYDLPISSTATGYVRQGSVEVYSNDSVPFTQVQAVIYNTVRGTIAKRFDITIDPDHATGGTAKYWSTSGYQEDGDILDGNLEKSFQGYIGVGYDWNSVTNRFYVLFDYMLIDGGTATGTQGNHNHEYYVGLIINGNPGQRADVFCDGQASFLSDNGVQGWQNGSADGTISDMATGKEVLVVGSYNTADCWGSISDGYTYFPGYSVPLNEVTAFSSWGTLIDGRQLPHVVAPGATIVSSYNRYYTPGEGSVLPWPLPMWPAPSRCGWKLIPPSPSTM